MNLDPELETTEKIKASLESLTTSIQSDLIKEHHLDPTSTPDLKRSSFIGYTQQQMQEALGQMGLTVEGGLGPACVFTIPYEPGAKQIEQALWLDIKHPYIRVLKDFTDYNFQKYQQGFLIVAEEVSHLLYKSQYYQKYGVEPPEWMVEMVGALDKYNLLQKMYLNRHGRTMNSQENQSAKGMIFTALDAPPGASPEHGIGHNAAERLVNQLNGLVSTGRQNEATALFTQIYTGNETTVSQIVTQQ